MPTSSRAWTLTTLVLALVSPTLTACTTSGFECGTPLASDPDLTYTCSRSEEVCICATRSCARPEHPTADDIAADAKLDASTPERDRLVCPSGLRYVHEVDFVVDDTLVDKCVAKAHAPEDKPEYVLNQRDSQSRCPGSPPIPESSTTDMTTDTTTSGTTTTDMTTAASTTM